MQEQLPASEKKAQNASEMFHEMLPFLIYAALPILFTITVAYTFGSRQ